MDINNSDFIVIEWKSEKKVMLRKIINDAWDIVAFEVSRDVIESNYIDTLKDDEIKELKYHGIYFLLGTDANGDEKVYIGQGSIRKNGDGVFARVKEHTKQNAIGEPYFSAWDRAIIFASKYRVGEHFVAWDKSVISALESIMISVLPNSWNNKIESQSEQPLEAYSNTIKQIEVYSAFLGLKAFRKDGHSYKPQTMTIAEYERYNKFESIGHCKSTVPDIRTPIRIVKSMLNLLPDEVWNDETVFFDPACKGGEFLREIFDRLMTLPQLVEKYPNITIRTLHILSKQLFGIALTEESRKRTVDLLSNGEFDFNIKTVDNYIQRLKNGEMREIIKEAFGRDMEFSVVIGNPPYNERSDGGSETAKSSKPLHTEFVINAVENLDARIVSFVMPCRWYTDSDKQNKHVREILLTDSLRSLHDYPDSKPIFSGVNIRGGVCHFVYDKEYHGLTNIVPNLCNGNTNSYNFNFTKFSGMFYRVKEMQDIIKKVDSFKEEKLKKYVLTVNPFGFLREDRGSTQSTATNNIVLHASHGSKTYVNKNNVTKNSDKIGCYKVITGYMQGADKQVLGAISVLKPNEVCTLTYIVVYTSENEEIARNCAKYLSTKFARSLLKIIQTNSSFTPEKFALIPLQDFTSNNPVIDWSKPIDGIDNQLYKKYGLIQSEIDYINSTISPMK